MTAVARGSPPAPVSLCIAVESFTFDRGREAVYVHPGAVFLASNPVIRGHEAYFRPLVLVAENEGPDLGFTEVPVLVTSRAGTDPFSWVQMKIAGTVQSAETSLYNVGE